MKFSVYSVMLLACAWIHEAKVGQSSNSIICKV